MREERRSHKGKYGSRPHKDAHSERPNRLVFPSPDLLESYEEISPGLASKFAELIKSEQRHRHDWENRYLNSMNNTARIGQLLGFALAIITIYATLLAATEEGKSHIAIAICISGFAFLSFATIISTKISKRIPRPKKPFGDNRRR